ncbi:MULTISPECIES: DUF6174 domain-containing protein [Streptomyces]|uniref:DUF6174 domain-containing protein n=1 Tax=Streptomyces TaxID=1883 RepID=UPI0006B06384|nr:DUF6174 domain-containing protein [Streptomyces sp. AS58]KOV52806.1 lipoprotein [Streptomyces sp. AS58]
MTAVHRSRPRLRTTALIGALMCATVACGSEEAASTGSAARSGGAGATSGSSGAWEEPSSYTYTLVSSQGERALIGTFRVTVRDGEVARAVGLDDSGRQVVRRGLAEVPTIGMLLEELEQARRDAAHTAEAEYAADGHPVRISLDREKNTIDDEALYVISGFTPADR